MDLIRQGLANPSPRIFVLIYSSEEYEGACKANKLRLIDLGYKDIVSCSSEDLDNKFKSANLETLSFRRGAGYWLWKPYLIIKLSKMLREQDYIFYLDAGVLPLLKHDRLFELVDPQKITVWISDKSDFREWTDPRVNQFYEKFTSVEPMNCQTVMAGALFIPNSKHNIEIIKQWFEYCKRPNLLRPDSLADNKNVFFLHRHDQSLLNWIIQLNRSDFQILDNTKFSRNPAVEISRQKNPKYFLRIFTLKNLRAFRNTVTKYIPSWLRHILRFALLQFTDRNLNQNEKKLILEKIRRG